MRFNQSNYIGSRPASVLSKPKLAAPIEQEKDRAEAAGATIESGVYTDLIDPVYDILNGAGVWSDVTAFHVAGVRDVVSGSQSKWYDQSGNQNDATQSTSSARPTDTTASGFNGHVVGDFDPNDDILDSLASATQPNVLIAVHRPDNNIAYAIDSDPDRQVLGIEGTSGNRFIFASSVVESSGTETSAILTGVYDGANSVLRVDNTQTQSGDAGTNDMNTLYYNGNPNTRRDAQAIAVGIVIDSRPSTSVLSDVETALNDYYSIY
ncbi:hypothetical protein OSG_eHP25_00125 [environmental Halophage eHP-25]|nr:hypothetical protein OSG_eHP25_00125 [environmental Halophage eHP-25]